MRVDNCNKTKYNISNKPIINLNQNRMKKFTLFFSLMLMFAATAMAQVTVTIDNTTGQFTQSNASGTWHSVWESYDEPIVTLSVGANNMTVDANDNLQIYVGQSGYSAYTLTAPEGYCVAGYSFDFVKAAEYTDDVTLTIGDSTYTPSTDIQSISVNGLKERSASFLFTGANKGITLSNFVVTLEEVTNCTITYCYVLDGEIAAIEELTAIIGASYPSPTLLPYGVEITSTIEGTVSGDETIELECTYDNSIRFASDFESIKVWYYMTIHAGNKWYLGYTPDQEYIPAGNAGAGAVQSVPEGSEDAYTWAFIGNPFKFQIVNMAAGEGMVLASTDPSLDGTNGGSTYPLLYNEADLWEDQIPYWYAKGSPYAENGIYVYQHGTTYALNTRQPALAYWTSGADSGSTLILTVRDTEKADAALMEALGAAIEEARYIIDSEAGYTEIGGEPYALQGSDPAASYYVWTNAPEPNEGSIDEMFDGNPATYFHSNWSENGISEDGNAHNITIDLGAGNELSEFGFRYMTRAADNDHIQELYIQGSNDNIEFTDIICINSGLPVGHNKTYVSEPIEADEAYRYIRFMVTKTNKDRIGAGAEHNYFHMAEFSLETPFRKNISGGDEYIPYIDNVKELYDMLLAAEAVYNNPDATEVLVMETTEALVALTEYIAKLVAENDDEETIALVNQAKELIALTGVGYPAEAPRAALQAAIDSISERPITALKETMQEAITTYISTRDVTLPEYGKKYAFTVVAKNGNKFYLNYTGEDIAIVPVVEGESYPTSAAFECEMSERTYEDDSETVASIDTAFSFKTGDDKYLVYHSNYNGVNWLRDNGNTTGFQEGKDEMTHIKLEKLVPSDYVVAQPADVFGCLAWHSYRGWHATNNVWSDGYVVILSNGTNYDGASAPFWNDGYTSAFRVEEYVEGETAIEEIKTVENHNGIYDLTGRRIENPAKGIYIINGKKVLVK